MRLLIEHRTAYRFSQPQRRLIQLLRLTPASFVGQAVVAWRLDVDRDARLRAGRDGYGNETTMLYVDGPLEAITLTVTGEVLTEDRAGMVEGTNEPLPPGLFLRATPQTQADAAIADFAATLAAAEPRPLGRLHALCAAVQARIAFDPGDGNPHRDAATAFADGHGVCQDHAHIFIAAARLMGHPARYVSGHLWRSDGALVQPAAHAWAEAWLDEFGWVGFDPANGHCPTDAYVRVAAALDYRDAAPISGARIGGGDEALHVDVAVAQAEDQRQS
ncbi:transglutaminase family protein [Sphingomonas morindae]|uniref:Transglutaminase family protein n=1 Tax=Sphingomonas morindae TaxID=1541170 RepID=A0ABY4X593_9SPHN|nr:transglutaminase family protein [Sphingomonas morindae]USI72035.1 transglutaminase family protein [Sphingomonas morindae]